MWSIRLLSSGLGEADNEELEVEHFNHGRADRLADIFSFLLRYKKTFRMNLNIGVLQPCRMASDASRPLVSEFRY